MSSSPAKSSVVNDLRWPFRTVGSMTVSTPSDVVPSAQCCPPGSSGTFCPACAAFEAGPTKTFPETNVDHDGLVPTPRTCPISCSATVKKSVWLLPSPLVFRPKNQLVEPELSKAIEPPQGPKSVGVGSSAPACPRAATRFSQLWLPWALKPPVLPSPASEAPVSPRPPT